MKLGALNGLKSNGYEYDWTYILYKYIYIYTYQSTTIYIFLSGIIFDTYLYNKPMYVLYELYEICVS